MDLTLDTATEQRIQREIDRGHYREPSEVIASALDLLQAEEEWLAAQREAINKRLDSSFAQIQRGEGIPADKAREILALRRARRSA